MAAKVKVGEDRTFLAQIVAPELAAPTTTSTSSNPAIARIVGSSGAEATIQGMAAGTVTITATNAGVSGTLSLTVTTAPDSVIASMAQGRAGQAATLLVGGRTAAVCTAVLDSQPYDPSGAVWTTSDPTVVAFLAGNTGDAVGIVGVGAGTATLTVTIDGVTGTISLTVAAGPSTVTIVPY